MVSKKRTNTYPYTYEWVVNQEIDIIPKMNNPVLISGVPGIGNIGRMTTRYLIEELKAKQIFTFFSKDMPHSAFIGEDNLVSLPSIKLFYAKTKKRDLLILTGDVAPTEPNMCYSLTEIVLEIVKKLGTKELVAVCGIGLPEPPKPPNVYYTGNNKEIIRRYHEILPELNNDVYGNFGPIAGLPGLLVGMASRYSLNAVCLMVESCDKPVYFAVDGGCMAIKALNGLFGIGIDEDKLIRELESITGGDEAKSEIITPVKKQTKSKTESYIG